MLELNATPADAAPADLIKEGTDAGFKADVIDASQDVPVIVDFWAPWCGPCKTLGPALEQAVKDAKGRVKMVKIDVDTHQAYAGQLQVQSIPTVYAFHKGQPVDGFQGALPPSEITAFVNKLADLAGPAEDDGLGAAIEAAEQMLADGDTADAIETFAAVLTEDPNNVAAYAGLVRGYLALDDVDQAEAVLNGAPAEISTDPQLEAVFAQITLAREAASAGPLDELQRAVDAAEDDHAARLELAKALYAAGRAQDAVDQLLELFRRDRDWQDGAAKAQLFTIFDAHDPKDPLVLNGRRKLSSMIFA